MNKCLISISIPIIACCILYLLTYSETMYWHISAIGRIVLIKLLPIWDWTALKNNRCLIPNIFKKETPQQVYFNCDLCENIGQIDIREDIENDMIKFRYLDVHQPVIIKQDPGWGNAANLPEAITTNKILTTSVPCNIATNVYDGFTNIGRLLKRAQLFDSFFMHFQNCEKGPMRHFRSFAPRPKFIPTILSSVQYNWLLWSRNYNTTNFKPLRLVEKYAAVVQVMGSFDIRLVPHRSCDLYCPVIDTILKQGEALMFSSLWDFEYRSGGGENVAVILEFY